MCQLRLWSASWSNVEGNMQSHAPRSEQPELLTAPELTDGLLCVLIAA